MKRSPLRRGAGLTRRRPLYQRTPLRATTGLQRRKPPRQRSPMMEKLYREVRGPLVEKILEERPLCQRCLMARSAQVHEVVTRARGGSIIDEENCRALCSDCHGWIHDHPRLATEEGWLKRRD